MAYPNHVVLEFCHRFQIWRAFDGRKIVAFHPSENTMDDVFPDRMKIRPHETRVKDSKGSVRCVCRCE